MRRWSARLTTRRRNLTITRRFEPGKTPGYEVIGAVVLVRDRDGKVHVKEHGDKAVGHGAPWAGAGVVVGLFAPPLLAATAVGAGVDAILGKIKKDHDEKQFGVDVDEYLAPGTFATVVVDTRWADKVEKALVRSDKRITQAIDPTTTTSGARPWRRQQRTWWSGSTPNCRAPLRRSANWGWPCCGLNVTLAELPLAAGVGSRCSGRVSGSPCLSHH